VTHVAAALAYRDRIRAALPADSGFTPLMTAYLTDATDPREIEAGFADGVWVAAKLYPAHATTNSAHGVTDILKISGVLDTMQRIGMPLLIHGEVTAPEIDIFDREAVFVERVLIPLRRRLPGLRIVLEHVTTEEASSFVAEDAPGIAATVTPHHLVLNRNALFEGGLRPHAYCLPVVKRERHRQALRRRLAEGNERFFLGTDSAPHARDEKESACGCAGTFTAHAALELYAEVFEEAGALARLEGFASLYGADFYGLPHNERRLTLERAEWQAPASYPFGDTVVVPWRAGKPLRWRVVEA
jgi:dihydroorotase